jgi:hypothetical protein
MSPPRATHVTPRFVVRRVSQSDMLIDKENIRDRLENRWPCSDTCTSQSVDTNKSGIGQLESNRSAGVWINGSARISRS